LNPSHDATGPSSGSSTNSEPGAGSPDVPVATRAWPSTPRAWFALFVLMLAYIAGYVDRQVLSLLVVPIKASLGLTETELGLLQGMAFGLFYTLLGLPIARLVDRSNRRNLLAAGIALWSLASAACGLARSYVQLLAARLAVGVGEATLAPSAISLLSDFFPPRRRALAISIYVASGSVGGGLAFLAGAAAIEGIQHWDRSWSPWLSALEPWQLVFMIVGLPGLLVSLLLLTIGEPPRQEGSGRADDVSLFSPPFLAFVRKRRALFFFHFIGFSLFAVLSYAVLSWVAVHFQRHFGWEPARFGYAFGWVFLFGGASGAISGGWTATRLRARGWRAANLTTASIGATLTAPVALAACLVPDAHVALALFALLLFMMAFPSGASVAAIQEITPNEFRGRTSALYYLAMNLFGLSIGAVSVGLVSDYVLHTDQQVGLAMAMVSGVSGPLAAAFLWIARGKRLELQDGP
jgi:MFS family permease